jgi:hypothetical protein
MAKLADTVQPFGVNSLCDLNRAMLVLKSVSLSEAKIVTHNSVITELKLPSGVID